MQGVFLDEYKQLSGEACSKTNFRNLAAKASGRSIMSLRKIADSALFKLVEDQFGDSSQGGADKMRRHFARGLDATALDKHNKHLATLAKENRDCTDLLHLSLALDCVPVISGAVAMRMLSPEELRSHPQTRDGLAPRQATRRHKGRLVLRSVQRGVHVQHDGDARWSHGR